MVDNQHKKIKGYRDLTEQEIALMNESKELASDVGNLCLRLQSMPDIDKRWLDDATMELQKGFMSLVRSIARPESF